MLDYVIRSGSVIDGTGGPARQADVGVRNGRIVAVGEIDEAGEVELDATGLIVMPGVVDPHTHYDAQLFWDPTASPSNLHGVTTVIGGNCGFTLAPINPEDADYIRRMMAKVEGMPLPALEHGVPWTWSSFAEYLSALEGNLGVNAGFLVGHCAIRRKVMGAERGQEVATDDEIAAMRALLAESLAAGDSGSPRRSREPTPTATTCPSVRAKPTAARCWPSARRWRPTRAPRSNTSPTAAWTPSAPKRSTS